MAIRQPIVSVMGHVDHGKSTILDRIRGTKVVSREAGGITQHIGATDVPIETIYAMCGPLIGERRFNVPGLLFIDTPGHYSFASLRTRGGALADMAVLVIDINEGLKPQTVESLNILKNLRTPFVVAANKIDLIPGWRVHDGKTFGETFAAQDPRVAAELEERLYALAGRLYEKGGFSADRFDKITDFTKTVAIIPISGKRGEGLADLLLILVGLAQKFLEGKLATEEGPGEGTVLEVKEEKGIGTAVDTIIYKGTLKVGDQIVVSSVKGEPIVTKVKGLQRPRPLDEIRDPSQRFDRVKEVSAAAGIRIVAQGLENAMAGGTVKSVSGNLEELIEDTRQENEIKVELKEQGIIVRGDAIGSLEALAFEAKSAELPIRKIDIGNVTRKDVVEASHFDDPLHKVVFAFNVKVNPDVDAALRETGVKLFANDVMYRLLEEYQLWTVEDEGDRGGEAPRDRLPGEDHNPQGPCVPREQARDRGGARAVRTDTPRTGPDEAGRARGREDQEHQERRGDPQGGDHGRGGRGLDRRRDRRPADRRRGGPPGRHPGEPCQGVGQVRAQAGRGRGARGDRCHKAQGVPLLGPLMRPGPSRKASERPTSICGPFPKPI